MNNNQIAQLSAVLDDTITRVTSLSGGDISQAYCLHTATQRVFCKLNSASNAEKMFVAEKVGLETIASTKTINVPKVYLNGKIENTAFLLLEYIDTKQPEGQDFERLGNELAQLHKVTADYFGLETNNFIGSLPQANNKNTDWSNFYIRERLWPQLKFAQKKGLLSDSEVPSINTMLQVCFPWLEEVRPSLLHGDLWSGNYLISSNGIPYLIDPAVYFGDARIDMAMTRLFGGFSSQFYRAYETHFSTKASKRKYDDLYQLYFLLVHLNLFGRSYYPSVKKILNILFKS